jgi:hypothetical protein
MEMRGDPAQDPLMSIQDVMAKGLAGVKPVGSVDLSMPICSEMFLKVVAESQTPDCLLRQDIGRLAHRQQNPVEAVCSSTPRMWTSPGTRSYSIHPSCQYCGAVLRCRAPTHTQAPLPKKNLKTRACHCTHRLADEGSAVQVVVLELPNALILKSSIPLAYDD